MKKLGIVLTLAALMVGRVGVADDLKLGFVNFKTCLEISKQGQQEKSAFEAMRSQMNQTLESTENELQELAQKLEDQEYMDGLSPSAEEELKHKFQGLSGEFSRYQNTYYQLLNQANYKMYQSLTELVSAASEKVRERHELALILNEESTFSFAPSLDVTKDVIEEMDRLFDLENEEIAQIQKSKEYTR